MALETDFSFGNFSLPSLIDVSATAQAHGVRRKISHRGSALSMRSAVSPASHDQVHSTEEGSQRSGSIRRMGSRSQSKEELGSQIDPRRFTPNLHASLVSEILNLRREVESKSSIVVSLEESLDASKNENARLGEKVATSAKESRTLQRQMQMLEGGTLSALEELARERDMANSGLEETKKRLETSMKRVRIQEEEAKATCSLWERERQQWDSERRRLDQKVHIVEGRLRTVLAEIEAASTRQNRPRAESAVGRTSGDGGHGRKGATGAFGHRRNDSAMTTSTHDGNERNVHFSTSNDVRGSIFNGASLADELAFEDEAVASDPEANYDSEALPEEMIPQPRPFSAMSNSESSKARRILGLTVDEDDRHTENESLQSKSGKPAEKPAIEYSHAATQYSPPPSPELRPQQNQGYSQPGLPSGGFARGSLTSDYTSSKQSSSGRSDRISMISAACQTVEQPPSPPDTPVDRMMTMLESESGSEPVEMKIASTQTDNEMISLATLGLPLSSPRAEEVPIIAIHPPKTDHSLSKTGVVLPPHTRNASCQASIAPPTRSVSIQTEEIRIDNRPVKLPPHLLPSALVDQESKRVAEARQRDGSNKPKYSSIGTGLTTIDSADTSESAQPAAHVSAHPHHGESQTLKRPAREEDLFAGFDSLTDAPAQEPSKAELSDDSFAPGPPIKKTLSKVHNSWKVVNKTTDGAGDRHGSRRQRYQNNALSVVESDDDSDTGALEPHFRPSQANTASLQTVQARKTGRVSSSSKEQDIRRTALISSGAAAHAQRARSPSAPTLPGVETHGWPVPPFPVPTRSSSRNIPVGASEGSISPSPYSTDFFGENPDYASGARDRPLMMRPRLRKSRSATATIDVRRTRESSPAPQTSPLSDLGSPHRPPLPQDQVSPYSSQFKKQSSEASNNVSGEAVVEQTSLVDAIAQTMIGEWMWKYVRRRRSFGMPEAAAIEMELGRGSDASNGMRHKRWVWLAPYERAVMWSSKQPTSGSALLGKSGRKLTIQSVLDVKDDAPMPKGSAQECFGRSILILTPQRALKFTATSRERHYLWLNALSFLSQSSLEATGLPPPSPHPAGQPQPVDRPNSSLRRPIRDSIRIAKGKSRPDLAPRRVYTSPGPAQRPSGSGGVDRFDDLDEDDEQAAEPPLIPRYSAYTRTRSSSGPKSMNSKRSFSASAKPSLRSTQSHDQRSWTQPHLDEGPGFSSSHGHASFASLPFEQGSHQHGNPLYHQPSSMYQEAVSGVGNFFESVGTMRMEAFVADSRRSRLVQSSSNFLGSPATYEQNTSFQHEPKSRSLSMAPISNFTTAPNRGYKTEQLIDVTRQFPAPPDPKFTRENDGRRAATGSDYESNPGTRQPRHDRTRHEARARGNGSNSNFSQTSGGRKVINVQAIEQWAGTAMPLGNNQASGSSSKPDMDDRSKEKNKSKGRPWRRTNAAVTGPSGADDPFVGF